MHRSAIRASSWCGNPNNLGGSGGDTAVLRAFLREHCHGEYFVYLCDDDQWIPANLLGRQVAAMDGADGLAFVQGGMAQLYPCPVVEIVPNASYLTYRMLDAERRLMFGAGLLPTHILDGRDYLRLFAADPRNRNIVVGATLFRAAPFRRIGALDRAAGVRWQAGYAILAGAATAGSVLYLDEPCVLARVDDASASFRGTQRQHMLDALCSIAAAFEHVEHEPEYAAIRNTMLRSVLMIYVSNKVGHALGWFDANPSGDIAGHFLPPITAAEFIDIAAQRRIKLSEEDVAAIRKSDDGISKAEWPRYQRSLAA